MSLFKLDNMKDGRLKNWRWWVSLLGTLIMLVVAVVVVIPIMIIGAIAAALVNTIRYGWLSKLVDLPTKYAFPMHNWWRKSQGLAIPERRAELMSKVVRETVDEILY